MSNWGQYLGSATAILGLALIIMTLIINLINRRKNHPVTKSSWLRVNTQIEKLRKDSDRHEVMLAKSETREEYIKEKVDKIDEFIEELRDRKDFPCPHHPLKSK